MALGRLARWVVETTAAIRKFRDGGVRLMRRMPIGPRPDRHERPTQMGFAFADIAGTRGQERPSSRASYLLTATGQTREEGGFARWRR